MIFKGKISKLESVRDRDNVVSVEATIDLCDDGTGTFGVSTATVIMRVPSPVGVILSVGDSMAMRLVREKTSDGVDTGALALLTE